MYLGAVTGRHITLCSQRRPRGTSRPLNPSSMPSWPVDFKSQLCEVYWAPVARVLAGGVRQWESPIPQSDIRNWRCWNPHLCDSLVTRRKTDRSSRRLRGSRSRQASSPLLKPRFHSTISKSIHWVAVLYFAFASLSVTMTW